MTLDTRQVSLYLRDTAPCPLSRCNEPVTVGIPLPKGLSADTQRWRLESSDGEEMPLQTRILDRWVDGSIRWVLLDFQATTRAQEHNSVTLHLEGGTGSVRHSINLKRHLDTVSVDTGRNAFRISSGAPLLFADVLTDGCPAIEGLRSELAMDSGSGRRARVTWQQVEVEEHGPLRVVLRADGKAALAREARLDLTARLHFYAASSVVRLLLTIRNPRRARHRGGIWELGDPGSVFLKDVSLVFRMSAGQQAGQLVAFPEAGLPPTTARNRLEIYQDSSGGENWASPNHVNRHGVVANTFRGYRIRADAAEQYGLRATPAVWLECEGGLLGAAVPEFWQNFPRAIRAERGALEIGLWPHEYADLHELQGGEQKTHEAYLLFGRDGIAERPLAWSLCRLLAHASPEWYADSRAVPYLTPEASDPNHDYLDLVRQAIEGPDSFDKKRETVDEYGWRNFGDIYADHEAAFHKGSSVFVSHYNNQYDAAAGFAIHFMRSADPRWWIQMDQLARHVTDIDVYHTDEDKAAYNHGLFWHTYHYVDAGRCTHRSYPRAPGVRGGGPSAEHDYSTGLLLHHFLTGHEASRETVLELARWVVDMDDGRKNVFRWLDRGPTGLASATGSPLYHGPGRAAGNSILTLLNAHTLTGKTAYLEKAEELIRRCIHPADDLDALNLLDAERRWYYNVFLQVLGRYLHAKAERGELDGMYGYARASLLHYARWMWDHEYPYLEKPEILEYPNETWAAQDMRKSEVFMHAALHADGEERARFEERAAFFFDHSTSTLRSWPTHGLARPTVLTLVNGYMRAWFLRGVVSLPGGPAALESFPGGRDPFVPQKTRALRRAKLIGPVAVLAALCGLGLLALRIAR